MKTTINQMRWQAVVQRDQTQDGVFYYAVKTTGVYCKPSCASRLAHIENMTFYDDIASAQHAGYRPCKRCKPEQLPLVQQHAEQVRQACALISTSEQEPSLDEIAQHVGMSRHYFHRLFKQYTGVTPKAYARNLRNDKMRNHLQSADTITQAIYDSGFASSGRFYANTALSLGMTPSQFRQGGKDTQIYFALAQCSLGSVLVASSQRGICAIALGDTPEPLLHELQQQFPQAQLEGGDRTFEQYVAKIITLIDQPSNDFDLPLDIRGTAFQQRVWQTLRDIPPGETLSYSELAARMDIPKATRAVASACAANKLAVLVPCHRVVRQNGALSNYRWGIERKRSLLKREAST